jgi:flagellin-like hook-associated protein FlgL
MSVVINTNSAATIASNNLSASNAMLQRSLNRLSSGSKIVNASDDAGGVAVAARLSSAAKRSGVAGSNISNAVAFLQHQDTVLKTMGKMLERMSELQSLNSDVTKSSEDKANYELEFDNLKTELTDMKDSEFNGVKVVGAESVLAVRTNESDSAYTISTGIATNVGSFSSLDIDAAGGNGTNRVETAPAAPDATKSGYVTINSVHFDIATNTATELRDAFNAKTAQTGVTASIDVDTGELVFTNDAVGTANIVFGGDEDGLLAIGGEPTQTVAGSAQTLTGEEILQAKIQSIAEARAQNGADQSVLGYRAELASASKSNYESAVSKIMDVDVAEESTQLARWNTLVQAGTAMIAQANGSTQSALTLLR